jgi:MFS family permease
MRPLRESRDFRLVTIGALVTGVGNQAALVALPYQVFVLTGSPFQTGLLGLVELLPHIVASLYAGALADRFSRRSMLLAIQIFQVAVSTVLAVVAFTHVEAVWALYVLAALVAGTNGMEWVVRIAVVPTTVAPRLLRSALSLTYGLVTLTMVIGPAIGGLLIAWLGVGSAYTVDAVTCLAMAGAAWLMSPLRPVGVTEHESVWSSIRAGLGFVRRTKPVMGGFVIDLAAMTFGMPRALFPVLSLEVYHAGAAGTGFLFAAVSAGATIAALTAGWLNRARYLGRIVLVAVAAWGVTIALAGVVHSIWPALLLFGLAGSADSISAICRNTISQSLTPDHLRGRMSSVYSTVVAGGPRLGDIEAGAVGSLASPRFAVVSGGLACIASVGLVAIFFPQLASYDGARYAPTDFTSEFEASEIEAL